MTGRLPVTITPHPGQALDCYLEHLAAANGMTTAALTTALGGRAVTPVVGLLAPSRPVARRLTELTGLRTAELRATTIAVYGGGRPLDLTGLDPDHPDTYRILAARGWMPGQGTQICPDCLATTGVWQLRWRLPTTTVCALHRRHLTATCPGCRRPFRAQRQAPLRPDGVGTSCDNPTGRGPARHCDADLTAQPPAPATAGCLDRQRRHYDAVAGHAVVVLGEPAPGEDYLRDSRALAILLLHLAVQAGADQLAPWAGALREEARRRPTTSRGVRWGIRPPTSPAIRSHALTVADGILTAPDVEMAAAVLVPWLELTPHTPDGVLGWLADHTVMTPTLTRVVFAARAPHRRLSHHLDTRPPMPDLRAEHIPQVIPADLYRRHLAGTIDRGDDTARLFAALALARTLPDVYSWAAAATVLGLLPDLGVAAARACSARLRLPQEALTARLEDLAADLADVDYRYHEGTVRALTRRRRWFTDYATTRPGTRPSSKGHAITWLWVHHAHGHLLTSPAWLAPPDRQARARYRAFERALTEAHAQALASTLEAR